MIRTRIGRHLLLLLCCSLLCISAVQAQFVNNLKAANSGIGDVTLSWYENNGNLPDGYYVLWKYYSASQYVKLDSFAAVWNVYNYQKTYTFAPSSPSARLDTISLIVRAKKGSQFVPDAFATSICVYHGQTLSSYSKDTAYVNTPFNYSFYFWRESFMPASVKSILSLENAPAGMTIDTANYKVNWTPTAVGDFSFTIKAETSKDTSKYKVERLHASIHVLALDSAPVYITVITTPETKASVGTQYTYQLTARLAGPKASQYTPSFYYRLEPINGYAYPTGLTIGSSGAVRWTPTTEGDYGVSLRIRLKKDTTVQSFQNLFLSVGRSLPTLLITKWPGMTATRNVEYGEQMQVKFVGDSTGMHIRYRLEYGPPGMIVNAYTGHVLWTPKRNGVYEYRMQAYIQEHPEVTAMMWNQITVGKPEQCSYIIYSLSRPNGDTVSGTCTAWKVDEKSDTNQIMFSNTSGSGYFVLALPQGKYKLQFKGPVFKEFWYSGASGADNAQVLNLPCDDTLNLQSKVQPFQSDSVRVQGSIRGTDGALISSASVRFLGFKEATHLAPLVQSPEVPVDAQGKYAITLDPQYRYIIQARCSSDTYRPVYSGNVVDICEAARLTLDNSSVVDLRLPPASQNHTLRLNSTVSSSTAFPTFNTEVFYKLEQSADADMVVSSPPYIGTYHDLAHLASGNYAMLCIPHELRDVPMFATTSTATLDWTKSILSYPSEDVYKTCDITLSKQLVQQDGACRYYGTVSKPAKGGGTTPVPGVLVYVLNNQQSVVGYGCSDSKGEFDIRDLPTGEFSILAVKVGITIYHGSLSLNMESRAVAQENIVLDIPLAIEERSIANGAALSIAPQPCSTNVNIHCLDLVPGSSIKVYNIWGQCVYSYVVTNTLPSYNLPLPELESGFYSVQVQSSKGILGASCVISR